MKKQIIRYSSILSVSTIIYFLITNFLNVSGSELAGWMGYLPYMIVIYIGQKNNNKTLSSYKSRLFFGIFISMIAALISSLFMFIYLTYIDDLMVRTVIENQIDILDKNDINYDQSITRIKAIITPLFYFKFGVIVGIVIGTIISAITAIFTKVKINT